MKYVPVNMHRQCVEWQLRYQSESGRPAASAAAIRSSMTSLPAFCSIPARMAPAPARVRLVSVCCVMVRKLAMSVDGKLTLACRCERRAHGGRAGSLFAREGLVRLRGGPHEQCARSDGDRGVVAEHDPLAAPMRCVDLRTWEFGFGGDVAAGSESGRGIHAGRFIQLRTVMSACRRA